MRCIYIIQAYGVSTEYVCIRQAGYNMWDNDSVRELKERRGVIKKGSLLVI